MPEEQTRECPLCGGTMKIKVIETVVNVPGNPRATAKTSREWICPDCDYFEEIDEDEARSETKS
jgi:C4-type Zn-finger protein